MINIKTLLGLNTYTSEVDLFLEQLRENDHLSTAQRIEKEKYKRIYALRDHTKMPKDKKSFWENF